MSVSINYCPPEIDFSAFPDSDGLPMAETDLHRDQLFDLIAQGREAFNPSGHYVSGNMLVYYDASDGWKHLSPDVFIVLDAGVERRRSWKTWVEGAFPHVVFEIVSPSTGGRDLQEKLILYGALGVREYYIFDPDGMLRPPLRGYRFREELPVALPNPSGASIRSTLLDRELRVVEGCLRLIDPATNAPYPLLADERRRADAAVAAQSEAEAEVARLRAELTRLREGR